MVEGLFKAGASVDALDLNRAFPWWTILSAASQGHIQIVRTLLLRGGVDVNFRLTAASEEIPSCARIYFGRTSVHLAVCNQQPEKNGCIPNRQWCGH